MRNIEGGIRDESIFCGGGGGGDRNALISIGGMRDSFEIDNGMRDLNSK